MYITPIFALLLALPQQPEIQTHPDDPLHHFAILDVCEEPVTIEVKVEHEGYLHVWASSKDLDPRLSVANREGDILLDDDNSGGGTTPFLTFTVSTGVEAKLTVAPSDADENCGIVELQWIASVETRATRSLAADYLALIAKVQKLVAAGDKNGARETLEPALSKLNKVNNVEFSHEVGEAVWKLGHVANRLSMIQVCRSAWEFAYEHRVRILPNNHPDLLLAKNCLGVTMLNMGDLRGARTLFEAAIEGFSCTLPKDHPELLHAKSNLAITMILMDDFASARKLLETLLDSYKQVLPEDHPDLLDTKGKLAATLCEMGKNEETRAIQEDLIEAYKRTLPEDHLDLIRAKEHLANTMNRMGDFEAALVLYKDVLEARLRTLPKDHPDLIASKHNLAAVMFELNDFEAARALEESVVDAYTRILSPSHPFLLSAKENLASMMSEMGDLDSACMLAESIVFDLQQILPEDHPSLLSAQANLANLMSVKGDYAAARKLEEAVLETYIRNLPEDHPNLLRARGNLASTLYEMGDLGGSRVLFETVLEAFNRLGYKDHPELIRTKSNLAATMYKMGDYHGACVLLEEVLESFTRLLPENHLDLLSAKLNLAVAMERVGELAGARMLEESVLEAYSCLLPNDHPALLDAKLNLASTMAKMGDFAGARTRFQSVLDIYQDILPEYHPAMLDTKLNLAVAMSKMGDLAGARALEEAVLDTRSRIIPKDHPSMLLAKTSLAKTMTQMGDFKGVNSLAHELAEDMLSRCKWGATSLSQREVQGIVASELHRYSLVRFFTSYEDSNSARSLRFCLAETLRSIVSFDLGSILSPNPEIIKLRKQIADVRTQIGDLFDPDTIDNEFGNILAERVLERDKLESKLRKSLTERGAFVDIIQSEDIAPVLPEGAAVIGFILTKSWKIDKESNQIESRGNVLAAHMLKRNGSLFEVELGSAEDLERLVTIWRDSLGRPIGRGITVKKQQKKGRQNNRIAGTALRSRLLDPLLAELDKETQTLLICVDDFVHTIPLDALPMDNGYVGDRFEIMNQVSFRRLVSPRPPIDATAKPRLLAIGGINYDAGGEALTDEILTSRSAAIETSDRSGNRPTHFSSLSQTSIEAEAIGMFFKQTFDSESTLLQGAEATKASFVKLAPGIRYLHIATHGWFAPMKFPELKEDALTLSSFSMEERVSKLTPMILCGLAFAGANHGRNELGRVPGIMTAEELAGIDLSACELAVLSACETNVGIRSAGVGIQSLKAALHAAGVRTAITSLWKVDDAATRKLMELFYYYLWQDKMPKAKALWKAKMALIEEGHPVRDWAAWVLSGDPD